MSYLCATIKKKIQSKKTSCHESVFIMGWLMAGSEVGVAWSLSSYEREIQLHKTSIKKNDKIKHIQRDCFALLSRFVK